VIPYTLPYLLSYGQTALPLSCIPRARPSLLTLVHPLLHAHGSSCTKHALFGFGLRGKVPRQSTTRLLTAPSRNHDDQPSQPRPRPQRYCFTTRRPARIDPQDLGRRTALQQRARVRPRLRPPDGDLRVPSSREDGETQRGCEDQDI
jgi:hypothetical protein